MEVNDLNATMYGCVVSERGAHALMWLCSSLNFLCVFLCMTHDMNTCVIVSKQLKWTNKDHFSCLLKYIHNMLFKNARVTISETRQNH